MHSRVITFFSLSSFIFIFFQILFFSVSAYNAVLLLLLLLWWGFLMFLLCQHPSIGRRYTQSARYDTFVTFCCVLFQPSAVDLRDVHGNASWGFSFVVVGPLSSPHAIQSSVVSCTFVLSFVCCSPPPHIFIHILLQYHLYTHTTCNTISLCVFCFLMLPLSLFKQMHMHVKKNAFSYY